MDLKGIEAGAGRTDVELAEKRRKREIQEEEQKRTHDRVIRTERCVDQAHSIMKSFRTLVARTAPETVHNPPTWRDGDTERAREKALAQRVNVVVKLGAFQHPEQWQEINSDGFAYARLRAVGDKGRAVHADTTYGGLGNANTFVVETFTLACEVDEQGKRREIPLSVWEEYNREAMVPDVALREESELLILEEAMYLKQKDASDTLGLIYGAACDPGLNPEWAELLAARPPFEPALSPAA